MSYTDALSRVSQISAEVSGLQTAFEPQSGAGATAASSASSTPSATANAGALAAASFSNALASAISGSGAGSGTSALNPSLTGALSGSGLTGALSGSGLTGALGGSGLTGALGSSGLTGALGSSGLTGVIGASGLSGPLGAYGTAGLTGAGGTASSLGMLGGLSTQSGVVGSGAGTGASTVALPMSASTMLTSAQQQFAGRLAADTGLDPGVVTAWLLAEESGGAAAARQSAANNDWLNIGYTDSATYGSADAVWSNPITAADATAGWLAGQSTIPGYGTASAGIQSILSTVGQPPAVQIAALQNSGWASSGYPSLPALYQQVAG